MYGLVPWGGAHPAASSTQPAAVRPACAAALLKGVALIAVLSYAADQLGSGASAMLPRPRIGDLIAVLDTGAYGFTESLPLFLSHPTAAEVAVSGGRAKLIRPRITPAEFLDRQVNPYW